MKTYKNIEEFYSENEARRRSGEADYGVWWTEAGCHWPKYRVSYVQETGEVYAVQLDGGRVELLGIVPPDDGDYYYSTLDSILEGWADAINQPSSLTWVRNKLSSYQKPAGG